MSDDNFVTTQLNDALANYTPGIDRAVKFVTIDQVDMLAEFYLRNSTPSPALAALAVLAMRERAAAEVVTAVPMMPHMITVINDVTSAIRALSTTFTDAELLAAAMQLPEVRALVDVAKAMKPQLERRSYESLNMYTGKIERHFGVSGETWSVFCAALAQFTKGGE